MSKFYGVLEGSRGKVTRCGTRNSGLKTIAASFAGAIRVDIYEEDCGTEKFCVTMTPWLGRGDNASLITGILGDVSSVRIHTKEDQK